MYLPILMFDRLGWTGFLIFAIPNVLGCTAFGYVIRHPELSRRLIVTHRDAMLLFSHATIAFHVFFLVFLARILLLNSMYPAMLLLAVLVIALALSRLGTRFWPLLAISLYAVSLAAFVSIGASPLFDAPLNGYLEPWHAAFLLPTLLFGFLLCPYLDLTFHRALQQSSSRHTFAVFGITFALMLLLTIAIWKERPILLGWLALAHVVGQIIFTLGAHFREIFTSERSSSSTLDRFSSTLVMIAILFGLLAGYIVSDPAAIVHGESVYLRFLVFYGLIFPAYVALIMMPQPGTRPTRSLLILLGIFIAAALPLYELGFIHNHMWLLPLPLVGILGLVLQRRRTINHSSSTEILAS